MINIEIEPREFESFLKIFASGLMSTFDILPCLPSHERAKAVHALEQFREKITEWQNILGGQNLADLKQDIPKRICS